MQSNSPESASDEDGGLGLALCCICKFPESLYMLFTGIVVGSG